MAELLYQGHGSYRIASNEGVVIYVDPYAGEGYDMPADIVIVTHEHSDHNQVDLVTLKDDGVILRHGDLFVDGEYPIKKIKKVMIEGTPAENKNHTREECVGFIMTVDGIYNMSAQEASRCAHVIDSRYFIPIHTSPTQLYDEDIAKSFKSPHALYIKPGERLKL